MARWWQELLDRSICSLKLELQSLLGLKHIAAEMSRVNWQVRGRLEGMPDFAWVASHCLSCPMTRLVLL